MGLFYEGVFVCVRKRDSGQDIGRVREMYKKDELDHSQTRDQLDQQGCQERGVVKRAPSIQHGRHNDNEESNEW